MLGPYWARQPLGPCWACQLWEVPGDDNSSHCRLVPLCLGVHWDVHLGIVDEAGLAGLPEQRLFMCFEQSEFEVVDVIIFIWVVDSQVFVKGIVFSSVLYCVSVLQSATVARIPNTLPPCCHPPSVDNVCTRPNTLLHSNGDSAHLCPFGHIFGLFEKYLWYILGMNCAYVGYILAYIGQSWIYISCCHDCLSRFL